MNRFDFFSHEIVHKIDEFDCFHQKFIVLIELEIHTL